MPDLAPSSRPRPSSRASRTRSRPTCDAAGCIWFATERLADRSSCAFEAAGFCATASASTGDEDYDSTFYKRVGDVFHVRRVGRKAGDFPGPEHPAGWTECGLGPQDPEECACVCAAGRCPGDIALALLDACASPRPCDDEVAGDACLYRALAAEAAASLRVESLVGNRNDRRPRRSSAATVPLTWIAQHLRPARHLLPRPQVELPRLSPCATRAGFLACAAADPADRSAAT